MVVAILAILKTGAAYVPIDPEFPSERIRYIAEDSGAVVMLMQRQYAGKSPIASVLYVDDPGDGTYCPGEWISHSDPDSLAYVIYTSGSTGQPKGVMIEHKQVMNTLDALAGEYPMGEGGVYLLKTSYTFDVSVAELFGWMWGGGKLAILGPGGEKDARRIEEAIAAYGVTHITFVPSMLEAAIDAWSVSKPAALDMLRYVFVAGEAFTPMLRARLNALRFRAQIENIYGPTEVSIYATKHSVELGGDMRHAVPIGKPLRNVQAYIVSKEGQLQPAGIAGELCIAGPGVARGYLNREELTREKFTANPFMPGTRMYRTGDLAKWREDGSIVFLGRKDDQIKIRGYRMELGEIEAVLRQQPEVAAAAVIARTGADGEPYVCAYYVANTTIAAAELKRRIAHLLPTYMIPAFCCELPQLPLTSSGKLDRGALPDPKQREDANEAKLVPAGNEREARLLVIWKETLGLERIGVTDNFFELGGHSLKAVALIARIHQQFQAELPLHILFEASTVRQLAGVIAGASRSLLPDIPAADRRAHYPLSSAQSTVYMQSRIDEDGIAYNMPGCFLIEGTLDGNRLEQAIRGVMERHEVLRTSFCVVAGEPVQTIHQNAEQFRIERSSGTDADITSIMEAFVRPFDLGSDLLLRAELVRLAADRYLLLMDVHHLVADGSSISMILSEIAMLYKGETLAEPKLQYKDYTMWEREQGATEQMRRHLDDWRTALDGYRQQEFPTDFPRGDVRSFAGDRLFVQIGAELTTRLRKLAAEMESTPYMVLLALFHVLLHQYSGSDDIVVGTPAAGRTHPDLDHVAGMFVSTLPIRSQPGRDMTFQTFAAQVRHSVLDALDRQHVPFVRVLETLDVRQEPGRNPLFDTFFVYQNEPFTRLHLEECRVKPVEYAPKFAKFDLTLECLDSEDDIRLQLEYRSALFTRQTAEQMIEDYMSLLSAVAGQPETVLGDMELHAPVVKRAAALDDHITFTF
ncbi:Tyrocidine synthase 3 [compost metagenome]